MRPEDRDLGLLWDPLEHARIISGVRDRMSLEEYLDNRDAQLIAERALEIIGEIVKRISPATKARLPRIPWARIVSQRNVIAHEYGVEIEKDRIWRTATESVPEVVRALSEYLKRHPPDPEPDP